MRFNIFIAFFILPSFFSIISYGDGTFEKIKSIRTLFNASYPNIVLSDKLSYLNPAVAQKGLALYLTLEKITKNKSLRKDLAEIRIVTDELGGIKTINDKIIAILNLYEYTRPGQWELRLSTEIGVGNACEASPENLLDLRRYLSDLRQRPRSSVVPPSEWGARYAIDLADESPIVIGLLKELLALDPQLKIDKADSDTYSPVVLEKARGCHDGVCVLEKVFGSEELGLLQLMILNKYGMNPSYAQNPEEYLNWDFQILKIVETAMRESSSLVFDVMIKKNLSQPENPMKLVVSKRSPMVGPYKVLANASMTFYQEFMKLSLTDLKGFMMHELSHHLYDPLAGFPRYREGWSHWQSQSGWRFDDVNEAGWIHDPSYSNFVSRYAGSTNPEEDFAESVRVYRYEPSLLKRVSSEKYEFIKYLVFDGLEFIDQGSCQQEGLTDYFSKAISVAEADRNKSSAIDQCLKPYLQHQIDNAETSSDIFAQPLQASSRVKENIAALNGFVTGFGADFNSCFFRSVTRSLQVNVESLGIPAKYIDDWMRAYQLRKPEQFDLISKEKYLENLYLDFKSELLKKIGISLSKSQALCKEGVYIAPSKLLPFIDSLEFDPEIASQIKTSYSYQQAIMKAVIQLCR